MQKARNGQGVRCQLRHSSLASIRSYVIRQVYGYSILVASVGCLYFFLAKRRISAYHCLHAEGFPDLGNSPQNRYHRALQGYANIPADDSIHRLLSCILHPPAASSQRINNG